MCVRSPESGPPPEPMRPGRVLHSLAPGARPGRRGSFGAELKEVTMRRAAWVGILAGLICLGAAPAVAQPGAAGTLVVGVVAEPVNLDPAQVTDLNSNRVSRRVAETLVVFAEE